MKEHVGYFGFLRDSDLPLRSMEKETLLKHSADFVSFENEIQSMQLFDDIIDARVIFITKRY